MENMELGQTKIPGADHFARYEWAAKFLKALGVRTILDCACGVGYGTDLLDKAGFRAIGIDISEWCVREALVKYPRCLFVHGDLFDGDWTADAVVSFETIEHVADDAGLIWQLRRFAPVCLLSVPNEDVYPFAGTKPRGHVRHYTDETLTAILGDYTPLFMGKQRRNEIGPGVEGGRHHIVAARWTE